jgi:hypothetical protein
LIYHESAHNYQVNVKGNGFSRFLHSLFGVGSVFIPLPLSVPNAMENSFMLEGNAVLNESWHGNGGRLYSGRFKAQTILQAKAGKITPQRVYNTNLDFPYSETYYITGGFYHLYMAEKYGLYNLNQYFKEHSRSFVWPQFTNESMKSVTGVSFEDSLKEFAEDYASKKLLKAEGKRFLSSQYYYDMNSDKDEIYFISNQTGIDEPQLNIINKETLEIKKQKGSWVSGKVIKHNDAYYSVGYNYTSAFNIHQGLYDSSADILESSKSKIIQAYTKDSKPVYFNVKESFSEPNLYVGDSFYAKVNSSVFVDHSDNIYFFKQDGKKITLYKNNKAVFSYIGFYGIVSDVDKNGDIYFIANSKNGSSLYRYSNKKVTRAHEADNILGAKLLKDNNVVLSAVSDSEYYYTVDALKNIDELPFNITLFFEKKQYYAKLNYENLKHKHSTVSTDHEYNSLLDMHYSSTNIFMVADNDNNLMGNININFADPLEQNSASIYFNKDDSNISIGGLSYSSKQFLLNYYVSMYKVLDNNERDDIRDYGFISYASLPFMKFSRYFGNLNASFFQDYETQNREPISLSLNLGRFEKYGKSMYPNYLNAIDTYFVRERDDNIYGAKYDFTSHIGSEFYLNFGAKYSATDAQTISLDAHLDARGVKISKNATSIYDISQINIPNLNGSFYVKSSLHTDVGLSKVINFSKYFFTFPLSLQRESVYTKFRHYEIKSFSDKKYKMDEATIGLNLSLVGLNSFAFPINIEYVYNNDESDILVKDNHLGRVFLGIEF